MRLALFVFAAAFVAPVWQQAVFPEQVGARWCAVHNPGLGNIEWDCRFPTLALCATAVGPASDFCLQNPNWHLRRYRWYWG